MYELTERLRVLHESLANATELVRRQYFHQQRHRWSEPERKRRDLQLVEILRPLIRELEERLEALACAAEEPS